MFPLEKSTGFTYNKRIKSSTIFFIEKIILNLSFCDILRSISQKRNSSLNNYVKDKSNIQYCYKI